MEDKITIERINLLHPKLRTEANTIYHEIIAALIGKAICRFAFTLRSFAEQEALYAQGRTKPGPIVTWAHAGQSYHNYGLAIDIVLLVDKDGNGTFETASWETNVDFDGDGKADWMEIVSIFKKYGWEWGGDWVKPKQDLPHFQKTFGHSEAELLALFDGKKLIPNTNYVNI